MATSEVVASKVHQEEDAEFARGFLRCLRLVLICIVSVKVLYEIKRLIIFKGVAKLSNVMIIT